MRYTARMARIRGKNAQRGGALAKVLFVVVVVAAFGFVAFRYISTPTSSGFLDTDPGENPESVSSAAQFIYNALREQRTEFEFDILQDSNEPHDYAADVFELNGDGYLGPYLKWSQVRESGHNMLASQNGIGNWYAHYTVNVTYFCTQAQEAAFEKRLQKTVKKLKLHGGKTKRQKLRAIHNFIIAHVSYSTGGGLKRHTAYSALCKGQAVCQGYAALFYRLAVEAGVPCDIVSGKLNGTAHAWNIVKLGGTWYHVDETSCDTSGLHGEYYLVRGKLPGKGFKMDKEYRKKYFK